ncbi:unnamed protein product [Lepeophtheirus salmonis]|uniref:(salmon louse) hypothetical protein n=1 Tax=Lepeophtheirus salmonis TaxID=72036 RepID=A0A7R8CEC9_LEPSM|nr:unnamed protein product [Lepeophtheirus salmonis]CAF2790015.1 unnamed protein product [Lepeophtheirus salmonis]
MNSFIVFSAILAVSSASIIPGAYPGGYIVRAPKYDSATIESHRFGGNFAYSTAESHAFAKATPQVKTITHPVAKTVHTHVPAPIATHTPGKIVKTTHVAQPILKHVPVLAQKPVVGTVGYKTLVHQPLIKKTIVSTPVVHKTIVAAPVVAKAVVAGPLFPRLHTLHLHTQSMVTQL